MSTLLVGENETSLKLLKYINNMNVNILKNNLRFVKKENDKKVNYPILKNGDNYITDIDMIIRVLQYQEIKKSAPSIDNIRSELYGDYDDYLGRNIVQNFDMNNKEEEDEPIPIEQQKLQDPKDRKKKKPPSLEDKKKQYTEKNLYTDSVISNDDVDSYLYDQIMEGANKG